MNIKVEFTPKELFVMAKLAQGALQSVPPHPVEHQRIFSQFVELASAELNKRKT